MKKKTLLATAAALILISAFSINTYRLKQTPEEKAYDILTPAEDLQLSEDEITIHETEIPLSDVTVPVISEHPNIQAIVDLVNEERAKAGLAPLVKDPVVCQAAALRAEEIYTSFSHDRPDGSRYKTALNQVGYSYRGCGENVAYGFTTAGAVMDGWMNSDGHRKNILHEKFTTIGVGYYVGSNGYCYWSQMFAYE